LSMSIERLSNNLSLIPLTLKRRGFRHFIGAWIYSTGDTVIMVDPGPSSTVHVLLNALKEMNIFHIDLILLTHIHIDHAGGLGTLLKHYPDAKVICHPKGIPHLVERAGLWAASRKVLGEIAELYGEPEPVPGDSVDFKGRVSIRDTVVTIHETPGHASHHLSFRIGDLLFVGEAMGIYYQLDGRFYLRISSPMGFRIEDYRKSLALLNDLDASVLCFSHYGLTRDMGKVFKSAADQIEVWSVVIGQCQGLSSTLFEEKVMEMLMTADPALSCFRQLPGDIQGREMDLLGNSFKGFMAALNAAK